LLAMEHTRTNQLKDCFEVKRGRTGCEEERGSRTDQ
jgi:hypothetical protein